MNHEERNYQNANIFQRNSTPKNGVSIFIPNVWRTFNAHSIKRHFIQCRWGYVERVDIVPSKKSQNLNNVFVHFRPMSWNMKSDNARAALNALQRRESVKVFYSEYRYFNCFISTLERKNEKTRESTVSYSSSIDNREKARQEALSFEDELNSIQETESYTQRRSNAERKVYDDKHSDSLKAKSSSISYGRKNRKIDKQGIAGFFAAVDKRRCSEEGYKEACKLAYENKEKLPEDFEFPEENASKSVKDSFVRALYRHLGM